MSTAIGEQTDKTRDFVNTWIKAFNNDSETVLKYYLGYGTEASVFQEDLVDLEGEVPVVLPEEMVDSGEYQVVPLIDADIRDKGLLDEEKSFLAELEKGWEKMQTPELLVDSIKNDLAVDAVRLSLLDGSSPIDDSLPAKILKMNMDLTYDCLAAAETPSKSVYAEGARLPPLQSLRLSSRSSRICSAKSGPRLPTSTSLNKTTSGGKSNKKK